jgi:hypothetical protein
MWWFLGGENPIFNFLKILPKSCDPTCGVEVWIWII